MDLSKKYKSKFDEYGVDTPLRVAHFMAQADAESGLVSKRESLYYTSIDRLRNTFYTPFKKKTDSFVKSYLRNSEYCANYVYANREGNSDAQSGDGYKYRGGGIFQNTFKNNYKILQEKTGIKFLENPDLILDEANSIIAALFYWKTNNLNKYADLDDLDGVSDKINIGRKTDKIGDSNDYQKRKECLVKWKKILNV